jgi:ribosomal protein S18 acetylase RimI-like enzyme
MPEIHKASVENIEQIRELAYATWPTAYGNILSSDQLHYMLTLMYSVEAITNQMEILQHQFILAYNDNIATGFASYSPKKAGDPSVYRLHKLYVLPGQQKKGTGKFLLDHITSEIIQVGARTLELNVNRQNTAFHFYIKLGFKITKEEDIDIGSGYFMNDYVMEKRLVTK